jgi:site-specific recombinase XerD
MTGLRYLATRSPERSDLAPEDQRFAALRDELIVNLKYNTARAYAGDLDHLHAWAAQREKQVLDLSTADLTTYLAGLISHPYTPNTIVRKRTALTGFYDLAVAKAARTDSPMAGWAPVHR